MIAESHRILGLLPQFCSILRLKPNGINKFFSTSLLVQPSSEQEEKEVAATVKTVNNKPDVENFRFKYPEFLPTPDLKLRNLVREKLERKDMLKRRNNLHIPEFYVGSVLAVTTSDKHALGKQTRFVGICIHRNMMGLNSKFTLRNVVENQGIEIIYYLYSPVVQKIEVLRLEKRLDDELFYLRDAPNEFSTFPMDMAQELIDTSKPVPVNTLRVPLNPRPWYERWERMNLKGAVLPELSEKIMQKAEKAAKPWEKYDLMDQYRKTTPEEEQMDILNEISEDLKMIEMKQKTKIRKKEFVRPRRQTLF